MDSALPPTTFIDPYGRNRDEIRRLLYRTVEVLLSNFADAEKRPPFPEEFADFCVVPEHSLSENDLFRRIDFMIEQSRNLPHPGYIAHMDSMPTTMMRKHRIDCQWFKHLDGCFETCSTVANRIEVLMPVSLQTKLHPLLEAANRQRAESEVSA